jgi:hypothetical protein
MPADSLQMQVERNDSGQFVKGQSGNPAGRERGSRNRATLIAEEYLDRHSGALFNKAVQMALEGDAAAMRLCISRILAPRRDRPSGFALPPIRSAADLAPAMAAIAEAVADGAISADEACAMSQFVEIFMRSLEVGDFAARLQRLEAANGIAGAVS